MREIEKWIWLDSKTYPNSQSTIYHSNCLTEEANGNYTVAEFQKSYRFEKIIQSVRLRFSGDTEYLLLVNEDFTVTGPVNVGGDYVFNETCRDLHYATETILYPGSDHLDFYARVKMMPVQLNEYSKGRGGFMLTAHITFADGTVTWVSTDKTWDARRNGRYEAPYHYNAQIPLEDYGKAVEIPNIWHPKTAPIPLRTEELLFPAGGGYISISAGEKKEVTLEYDKVYAAYLWLKVQTEGLLKVTVNCFELEQIDSIEEFTFVSDTTYRGLQMHSVGGFKVTIENHSDANAVLQLGAIATCYPAPECAVTTTSDPELNQILELCTHALKYCRQNMHLDSPRHCEPLACTGDYYIETLMTAFSFGDMRLAELDVRRTAELLRNNDGRLFHTTYSLIWVLMAYDVYLFTADLELLEDCTDALVALLNRFARYVGENGLIENPPDYMFVDWLNIDGIAIHHPSKNLGQSCMNMFYYGALDYGAKIFDLISLPAMAEDCRRKALQLKTAINNLLYNEEIGLYCEGLPTPSPEEALYVWLPQSNGKVYYRQHANILASYFGVCEKETAQTILRRVVCDTTLGDCQPYFMHFLLEAIYRNDLREELTLQVLEHWKTSLKACDKGLQEGFIAPEGYTFDLSHAWGGSPLYSLPKALLGFEMVEAGFQKIRLSPISLGLSEARVEMPTPYGKIVCEQMGGQLTKLEIPKEIDLEVEER